MNWLNTLRKRKSDRGLMADLRCTLVESKKHRAWPALSRLGIAVGDHESACVAGFYATHPEEQQEGNFGTTCREIKHERGEDVIANDNVTPTERRFQHLLAAERGEELFQRVLRMVMMAKSCGVAINYERLRADLQHWNSRTKEEWAAAYWAQKPVEAAIAEEDA